MREAERRPRPPKLGWRPECLHNEQSCHWLMGSILSPRPHHDDGGGGGDEASQILIPRPRSPIFSPLFPLTTPTLASSHTQRFKLGADLKRLGLISTRVIAPTPARLCITFKLI